MTTNIMSKIAAVLHGNPVNAACHVICPKYGDDDVSLKRTKDNECDDNRNGGSEDNDDHEYKAIFSKRPSQGASQMLNSTPYKHNDQQNISCCSDDFTGGPVSSETCATINISAASAQNNEQNDKFNQSITSHPSDSSFGFHNTFSVLEKQLNLSKQPKLNQRQIEYIIMKNNDTAVKNPIYIDIPINDEWCLHAVSGQANSSLQDNCVDDESPSLFELELEAMERVKQLLGTTAMPCQHSASTVDSSVEVTDEVDYASKVANTSLLEDFYQQDGGEYSDYVYHVAKSKDGHVYLRVVRSLLVDKGNFLQTIAHFALIEFLESLYTISIIG